MSSLTRSWQRKLIRHQVEKQSAIQKTKLNKKRKDKHKSLGVEKNITLFRRAWYKFHYENGKLPNEKVKKARRFGIRNLKHRFKV